MIKYYNKYQEIKNELHEDYKNAFKFVIIETNKEEANKKYEEAIKKHNLQGKKIIYIGCGVYTTEEGLQQMQEATRKNNRRIKEEILSSREELIKAFKYEMLNYEFAYMYYEDTPQILDNFNITLEELEQNEFYAECWKEAKKLYFASVEL